MTTKKKCTYNARVQDRCKVWCLIYCASYDVIVSNGSSLRLIMPMLFTNNIKDWFLNMQQYIFQALHITVTAGRDKSVKNKRNFKLRILNCNDSLQLFHSKPLHADNLIVASAIIKCTVREIVHNIRWVENRNPGTVIPWQAERIFWNYKNLCYNKPW